MLGAFVGHRQPARGLPVTFPQASQCPGGTGWVWGTQDRRCTAVPIVRYKPPKPQSLLTTLLLIFFCLRKIFHKTKCETWQREEDWKAWDTADGPVTMLFLCKYLTNTNPLLNTGYNYVHSTFKGKTKSKDSKTIIRPSPIVVFLEPTGSACRCFVLRSLWHNFI